MIHEYFIEPNLIYKWAKDPRDTKKFFNEIGLGSPRLLSTFPRSKRSKLRGELLKNAPADLGDVAKTRLDEFVNEVASFSIERAVSEGLPNDWFEAAECEVLARSPDLVIATTSCSNLSISQWITEDAIYYEPSKYDAPRQLTPNRGAESLAFAIANLLRYSNKIVVVDPYLYKKSGINSVKCFIQTALENRVNEKLVTLQLLFDAEKADAKHVLNQLSGEAKNNNLKIEALAITEKLGGEKFHNRYVLTELAGVDFGVGTDEGENHHSDDLTLLSRERYNKRWLQYWNAEGFEIAEREVSKD